LTYKKWIDFEENVLSKYLEKENLPIDDKKDDEILLKIITASIGDTMRKKSDDNHDREGERYSSNFLKEFDGFNCNDNNLHEENDNFDRDDDEQHEDMQETFNFKDYEEEFKDDKDEDMKLPEDIFAKFSNERKHSSESDDMVKTGDNQEVLEDDSKGSKDSGDSAYKESKEKSSPLQNISVDEEDLKEQKEVVKDREEHAKDFETTAF